MLTSAFIQLHAQPYIVITNPVLANVLELCLTLASRAARVSLHWRRLVCQGGRKLVTFSLGTPCVSLLLYLLYKYIYVYIIKVKERVIMPLLFIYM